mgnify:CR=1 FL=1
MRSQRRLLLLSVLTGAVLFGSTHAQQVTVRPGDTLWDIARRHGTSVEAIQQVNGLAGHSLQPGVVLNLPTGSDATPATYTVKAGDTLYDISVAFGMSVDDLIAFNNLDGNTIRPGQVLTLNAPAVTPEPLRVTVNRGDSLWSIANRHEVNLQELAAANGITAGTVLQPGHVLVVPGRYAGSTPAQGGAAAPVITVQPGDSLWSISRRYNTDITTIMAANDMSHTHIQAGQQLKIIPQADVVRASEPAVPPPSDDVMVWPLNGALTSYFGYRQLRIGGTNQHHGIDINGDVGDPIRAALGGVVTFSGWRGGFGNLVIIQNGDSEYYYAHANELYVHEGQTVNTGDVIATVGTTGRVTGAHLHFEVRVNGTPVDPLPLLEARAQR